MAVAQDASGHALETALALARGIGATRVGVLPTTFAQETELDLFQEQGLWPLLVRTMTMAFEFLVAQGFPPEMVALEMYGSGEATVSRMADGTDAGVYSVSRSPSTANDRRASSLGSISSSP